MKNSLGIWVHMLLTSMLLLGCNLQDKLLYYPDRHIPSESELARSGLRFWPSGREGYRGFIGLMPEGKANGTIIVLHGNAATAAERVHYIDPLRRLGYRVLLAEYPGYGGRQGNLGEDPFVRDARETIRLAAEMYGQPIFLLGESLGGAVAASSVRGAGVGVKGIVLITPWGSLERVAKEKFPLLPVSLFLNDKYDTAANLAAFQGRVAVVVAEQDDVIPPHHARELYGTFPGRKKMWEIIGAGHNDWPFFVNDAIWKEIMDFVSPQRATPNGGDP